MSTPRSPFTTNRQEQLIILLQQNLPSLDTSYEEFVDWLVSYIKDEDFYRIDTIRQDLLDPSYSDIKSSIQTEYKWDDKTLQIIINILLNDIFPAPLNNGNRGSMTMSIDEGEEETKVFYPSHKPRKSENELASAFAEAIGGLDQMSPSPVKDSSPNERNSERNSVEDDMRSQRSTSHIHDTNRIELTPPNTNKLAITSNRSQRGSYDINENINQENKENEEKMESKNNREHSSMSNADLFTMRGALENIQNLKRDIIRQESRWDGVDFEPIEDECNDEEFPWHLNVALFHRSDDESLELLIDKAVLEIYKGDKFKDLWKTAWFIKSIYNDKLFPKAVDKVFDLIDDVNDIHSGAASKNNISYDKKKLGFIGNFVDTHFQRQIKEYKRKIEVQSDDIDQGGFLRSTDSIIEDDEKRQSWLVYYIDNEYVIEKHKLQHKQKLMTLRTREDDKYSWAVWKKKTSVKKDNIRSKGYWDVIERYDEEEHWEKRWKDLKQAASRKQLSTPSSAPKLPFGKLTQMPTLKVIKTNSVAPATTNSLGQQVTNTSVNAGSSKSKKKTKFLYIPLDHLKLIFELMQFHYGWSIQSEVEKRDFEKTHENIINTAFYMRYCGKQSYEAREKECDKITIDGIRYTLVWWNGVGQKKCNAFCITIGDDEREYFYLRFRNQYVKFRWDWYDNDNSEYKRYKEGENSSVYKELEASFQSNIDENFPQKIFNKGNLYQGNSSDSHMFDICILPKVKEFLENDKQTKLKQNFVLRFSFTDKTNRITNIEQLSIHKDQQPFPRNVRRLINRRNTIYFYFQSTDEYIQEWKKRYCLLTLQQQKYFYSFILCICSVMKYIECEFTHQMISFPYKKSFGNQQGVFASLDDSDVQRHKRDFELWNGFFIPPEHQFQTSQISQDSVDLKNKRKARYLNQKKANVKSWYKSLAIVEPLKKFIYENKDKKDKIRGDDTKQIFCSHEANQCDTLWLSNSTQDVYCNRCAVLLQFSECIRKYVLECENREVTDFLWPWYRNYFHRRDVKKYHTYVAKYNLSHLFRIEDVLEKDGDKHNENDHTCKDNSCFCCCRGNESEERDDNKLHGIGKKVPNLARDQSISDEDNDEDGEDDNTNKNGPRTQIRHLRKFAAHVLLGGWDILRNLNVIRNQLQCIFGYFNETTTNDTDNDEDSEFISNLNEKQKWKKWRRVISKCNKDLRDDLNSSTARKLMKLHHEDQLSMKPKDQSIFSNLIDTILTHSDIYNPCSNTVIDGFHNGSFSDLKLDDDDMSDTFDARSEVQDMDKLRYYEAFKQSWKRVPDWWFHQHDKLLLELALKFNWDKNLYHRELTDPAKKQYYQVLLTRKDSSDGDEEEMSEYSQSLDDDDDDQNTLISPTSARNNYDDTDDDDEDEDDYVGYQEFQVWCENWRNIQHRLRYLTFVICDYFYKCTPSMVAIRIPIEQHRIEQYKTESIAFLNGYMARVHILNYKEEKIDLNNINEAQVKLKKIAQDYLKSKSSKKLTKSSHGSSNVAGSLLPLRTPLGSKQSKSSQWSQVLKDTRARRVIQGSSSKRMPKPSQRNRIRDPFMKRDLDFELEQICQSFDLLEYGVEMATFLIKLLKRKQLDALWSALGIVLEYMPYEFARHILEENQEDLRHGKPEQLKTVCDRIMRGSSFNVHIALFLADYMQNNSRADLARYDQWMKYSKYFEQSAGATINTIESNHLLAVLLDIPLTYSGGSKVSLLQVALEQNRAEFLNNERINAVMAHVWQSPSGLAPNTEIMQQNDSYFDIWWMIFDKPYHFYLTPMGFNVLLFT